MDIQVTFTAKVSAPDIATAAKGIHKQLDKFFDGINFTHPGNLVTSFEVVEIRPGSKQILLFPDSLDV